MEEGSRTKISKKGKCSEDTKDRLRYTYDEGESWEDEDTIPSPPRRSPLKPEPDSLHEVTTTRTEWEED